MNTQENPFSGINEKKERDYEIATSKEMLRENPNKTKEDLEALDEANKPAISQDLIKEMKAEIEEYNKNDGRYEPAEIQQVFKTTSKPEQTVHKSSPLKKFILATGLTIGALFAPKEARSADAEGTKDSTLATATMKEKKGEEMTFIVERKEFGDMVLEGKIPVYINDSTKAYFFVFSGKSKELIPEVLSAFKKLDVIPGSAEMLEEVKRKNGAAMVKAIGGYGMAIDRPRMEGGMHSQDIVSENPKNLVYTTINPLGKINRYEYDAISSKEFSLEPGSYTYLAYYKDKPDDSIAKK
jgi:hypothetical protein